MDYRAAIEADENILLDRNGNRIEIENRVAEGTDGTLHVQSNACILSYVDCHTKRTEVITLQSGDGFAYGDWNGSRCVRKFYRCP